MEQVELGMVAAQPPEIVLELPKAKSQAIVMPGISSERTQSYLESVTPELAQAWLSKCNWERQRPISQAHVTLLAEAMKRNEFTEGTQIHFARLQGAPKLINGQHTLSAIVKSGVMLRLNVLTTDVDDEEEIARLYSRHDIHRARSFADSFRAIRLSERTGLTDSQVNQISSAVKTIINRFANTKQSQTYETRSRDARVDYVLEYAEAGRRFFAAIKGGDGAIQRHLKTAFVLAVGLETFQHAPDQAYEFWRQVALDDGLKVGDPRKTLRSWLLTNPASQNTLAHRSRVCAAAWNAFLTGKEVERFRGIDAAQPIVIKLTSFKG